LNRTYEYENKLQLKTGWFILLETEFKYDAIINGFDITTLDPGPVQVSLVRFDICNNDAIQYTCKDFFINNQFLHKDWLTPLVNHTWTINLNNQTKQPYRFTSGLFVQKGAMIMIEHLLNGGRIAIVDPSANSNVMKWSDTNDNFIILDYLTPTNDYKFGIQPIGYHYENDFIIGTFNVEKSSDNTIVNWPLASKFLLADVYLNRDAIIYGFEFYTKSSFRINDTFKIEVFCKF
jgi:hypothetical protein